MQIAACKTYHAQSAGTRVLRMPDGKSVFKIYFVSIVERDKPEDYEWLYSLQTQDEFENAFLLGGHEGIGFVIAFPHITKVFRFSPYVETVLDVSEFHTKGMRPRDSTRADGSHEFACFAEAIIAAEEYRAWAAAPTVAEYLEFRCAETSFPVLSNTKLATYWERLEEDEP